MISCDFFSFILGPVSQKVLTMLAQLGRALGSLASQLCSIPYKRTLLAAFMLFLIVVKLDPGMRERNICMLRANTESSSHTRHGKKEVFAGMQIEWAGTVMPDQDLGSSSLQAA